MEPHYGSGLAQHLGFTHDLALTIDNADAALFQRDINPSII